VSIAARRSLGLAALAAALALAAIADAETALPPGAVLVPGGPYVPFYRIAGEQPSIVKPFVLDRVPVTNAEFLAFVEREPKWRRSAVSRLFADEPYLSHWAADLELGPEAEPEQPVTFVSWFAALAYCESLGARLPSEAEWEVAASPQSEDASDRAETTRRILAFYGRPRARLPHVGSTPPNALGVRDLHGVIWEWVEDFNAGLVSADSRRQGDREVELFCGGAAAAGGDPSDYATFMRASFRGSLEATHTLHHLGFRCARNLP
jgi:formylglycine-generating enzyme required for sulfatase activity